MYFPDCGSHLTIWLCFSKQDMEISWTECFSCLALGGDTTGEYATSGKWIRGYGTRLVWNSLRSTFRDPSKRREAVMDETTTDVRNVRLPRCLTLGDQSVQILVVGALNVEVAAADVVDGLVVDHEAAVRVLQRGVRGQYGVVRLDHRGGELRGRVDAELQLALLAVVDRQTLHQQGTEARAGATTKRVEDEEALQAGAVVGHASNFVEDLVDKLLAHGVMATRVVVGGVLLAADHLLRVEEGAVGASADLVNDVGLEIAVDGAGNVFSLALGSISTGSGESQSPTSFGKEGAEAMVVLLGFALFSEISVRLGVWSVVGQ
jgi:hypothetical protein